MPIIADAIITLIVMASWSTAVTLAERGGRKRVVSDPFFDAVLLSLVLMFGVSVALRASLHVDDVRSTAQAFLQTMEHAQ